MMKFEYDKDVDAAYIYLVHPISDGAVKKSVELSDDIVIDLDVDGKLLGIEILDASKHIAKSVLNNPEVVQ